jgi:pimeloyl-ACP methyl ester carboxylesterase
MDTAQSHDGTSIAFERAGSGPALILVDGALCRRTFGPMAPLAKLLAPHFTVFHYDRRGRGDSGDAASYSPEREVEDLATLIRVAGGSAFVYGVSSGAALGLHAAGSGLPITRLAMYEPPFVAEGEPGAARDHLTQLRGLVAADRRGAAVRYFMSDMVQAPKPIVLMMQLMLPVWSKLKAVAHTLPYDATIMGNWRVPVERAARVQAPTLVMYGGKTTPRLARASEALAAALPNTQLQVLAGQTHAAAASVVAPALIAFFSKGAAATAHTPAATSDSAGH